MKRSASWPVRHLAGNALYLGYIGFFVYVWLFADDAFAATWQSRAYDLVTLEFISLFVAAFFVPSVGERSLTAALGVVTGFGLVWGVFLLGVVEIAGWWAGVYFIGTNLAKALNGHDIRAAGGQLAWLLGTGFVVAFLASMFGVDPDAIFETHRSSLALWWLSYYAGLIVIDFGGYNIADASDTSRSR